MAGSARRIVVEFIGDGKSLTKELGQMESRTGRWGATLGKVGKAAALGLAAGVGAAGVALVGMTKNAMQDEAAQRKLAVAMRNSVGASDEQIAGVEDWIAAQGKALGVTDDELRPAFQRLVEATGSVSEAQRQMGIAMDVSAGTGKSLETVSAALMKANNGTTASLSKLGLKTKDAEGNTLSLDQALGKMSETFGGQAAAKAATLEGKMGRLRLMFDEAKESIGARLIPIVSRLADVFLADVVPAMDKAGAWARTNLLPVLKDIGQWIQANVLPVLRRLGEFIVGTVVPAYVQFVRVIAARLQPVFQQLVATFRADVMPTVRKVADRFQEWWPIIAKVVTKLAGLAATILGAVLPPIIRLAGFILSRLVPALLDIIGVGIKVIAKVVDIGGAFINAVGDVARFVNGVREKIGAAIDLVKSVPDRVRTAIGNLGRLLWNAGSAIIQGLIDGITAKLSALRDKLSSVTKLIPDWKGPHDKDKVLLRPAGIALMQGLIDGIESHKVPLERVLSKLTKFIEAKGERLQQLLDRRRQVLDAFAGFTSSVFGAQLDAGDPSAGRVADDPVTQLLSFQSRQRQRAEQLAGDVSGLLGKGLSKALLEQLQGAGESGIDTIHALAGATADQIAALNRDQAATMRALEQAGLTASKGLGIDDDIAKTRREMAMADRIVDKLDDLLKRQDENTIVELRIGGQAIHVSLLELKRKTGRPLNLG